MYLSTIVPQELEAIEIPGYTLERSGDQYYHLNLAPIPPTSLPNTPDILDHTPSTVLAANTAAAAVLDSPAVVPWSQRSRTPDSGPVRVGGCEGGGGVKGHRRSTSASVFPTLSSSASVTPVPVVQGGRRRGSVQHVGSAATLGNPYPSSQSLGECVCAHTCVSCVCRILCVCMLQ